MDGFPNTYVPGAAGAWVGQPWAPQGCSARRTQSTCTSNESGPGDQGGGGLREQVPGRGESMATFCLFFPASLWPPPVWGSSFCEVLHPESCLMDVTREVTGTREAWGPTLGRPGRLPPPFSCISMGKAHMRE